MNWPDYAILATIAISVLVGALRGFIKEVLALAIWALAFVLSYRFAGDVGALMEAQVSLPSARMAMGFAGIFLVVLVLGGLLVYLVGRLVESTGLSGTDRLLGGVFGAARGLAIVVAFLLVAGLTPIPADPWWKESALIQRLMPLVHWVAEFLPESAHKHLDFEPKAADEKTADIAQAWPEARGKLRPGRAACTLNGSNSCVESSELSVAATLQLPFMKH